MIKNTLLAATMVVSVQADADQRKDDLLWYIDGFKGLNDGFYQSIYHVSPGQKCLPQEIRDYAIEMNEDLANPLKFLDISGDFKLFS